MKKFDINIDIGEGFEIEKDLMPLIQSCNIASGGHAGSANEIKKCVALAKKYGADGVLINSVLPGLIHTAMWERAATEIAEATGGKMEDVIKGNGASVPVGRYGTSEEVASLVTFLCSDAASYISGTSIEVDGGQAGHI